MSTGTRHPGCMGSMRLHADFYARGIDELERLCFNGFKIVTEATELTMKNISWNTTKTGAGFDFKVYEIIGRTAAEGPFDDGLYGRTIPLKSGTCATRALAKGLAQRWVRHLRSASKTAGDTSVEPK